MPLHRKYELQEEWCKETNMPNQEHLRESPRSKFVREYMNDHNRGTPRWLRSIFFDEEEKIEAILEALEDTISKAEYEEAVGKLLRTTKDLVLTDYVSKAELEKVLDKHGINEAGSPLYEDIENLLNKLK